MVIILVLILAVVAATASPKDTLAPSAPFQKPVTTQHAVTIDGKRIEYEATAGHLTLTKEDGTERARVFFVAYTRKGTSDPATRPLTFSFNGGPGSSSVWLHLGVLGPRRVLMNDDGTTLPPPYRLVDNEYSWLDLTDMVFIDPVSTGYSRAADEKNAKDFHGYRQDIESVGEFVRRYVSDYRRWSSPKYLIGESYGTTRASALADHLQSQFGMYLNGVILVSAVLNFQTLDFAEGNDLPYAMFLPTYAATAWYHKALPEPLQSQSLPDVVQQARTFAEGEYATALMKGDALSASTVADITTKVKGLTGLSDSYVTATRLRPVIYRYCQELLRTRGLVIGRFDSRYTGPITEPLSEYMERDPSHHPTIAGCFSTCINDYLSRELDVRTTLPYEVLTGRVHPWDYSNVQNEYLNVAPRLRNAMVTNPDLRVWVANGYYDLATPFYGTEYTFSHMAIPPSLRKNVTMTYYPAGHMMYLLKESLIQMKADAKQWFK
ncbi:MAG TPA: peptidase S10 [Bacteroidetes bacterium]|nr:peptidase S10 [Bacteroidota bacterium]HRK05173.1 peptidase S10 [Chlorobiota bacterium]